MGPGTSILKPSIKKCFRLYIKVVCVEEKIFKTFFNQLLLLMLFSHPRYFSYFCSKIVTNVVILFYFYSNLMFSYQFYQTLYTHSGQIQYGPNTHLSCALLCQTNYTGLHFLNFFKSQEEELIILVAFFLLITNS